MRRPWVAAGHSTEQVMWQRTSKSFPYGANTFRSIQLTSQPDFTSSFSQAIGRIMDRLFFDAAQSRMLIGLGRSSGRLPHAYWDPMRDVHPDLPTREWRWDHPPLDLEYWQMATVDPSDPDGLLEPVCDYQMDGTPVIAAETMNAATADPCSCGSGWTNTLTSSRQLSSVRQQKATFAERLMKCMLRLRMVYHRPTSSRPRERRKQFSQSPDKGVRKSNQTNCPRRQLPVAES